jgi:lipopolysaccharide/colanic/teichoic acid biosynthesis glycosyltransferase
MYIVGPRPDIPVQVDQYVPPQRDRLQVKPGLTGISQVSGNTLLTWPERILLDIWYIKNRSFLLDMSIIGHTLVTIVKGETLSTDPFNVHRLLPGRTICP